MGAPDPIAEFKARLERYAKLVPAWLVPRMTGDHWVFGLLLSTGETLAIESIFNMSQAADGSLWVDVYMHPGPVEGWPDALLASTSRTQASVNVAHIVCALELADT